MKQLNLIVFLFSLIAFTKINAQKIDTVSLNQKVYYEYPFKQNLRPFDSYFFIFSIKQLKLLVLEYSKKKANSTEEPALNTKQSRLAKHIYRKQIRKYKRIFKKEGKFFDSQLKEAIIKNPYPFLESSYSFEKDITPCLDKIPDGEYVQFFEEFPIIMPNGTCKFENNRVAGIFHIKNNMLDGEAVWFNFKGDTLKHGKYNNGLKEGLWKNEFRKVKQNLKEEGKTSYVKNGYPLIDTTIEIITYKNGMRNGFYSFNNGCRFPTLEGNYTNNEETETWIERKPEHYIDENYIRQTKKENKVITAEYTLDKSKTVIKQPLVRYMLISGQYLYLEGYNFESNFEPINVTKNLYEIQLTKIATETNYEDSEGEFSEDVYMDENIDEEYPEDEYSEEEYEIEEENLLEEDFNYQKFIFDPISKKYLKRGKVIDSLGLVFNYKGIYEKHYPNGQLMFRYEFKEGKLLKEDTLFWDNGKPYDVINFLPDSNQYLQTIFDYDGKIYHEILFDSLGDFLRMKFQPQLYKTFEKEGLSVREYPNREFFEYDKMDSISYFTEKDSVILWKSWSTVDTSKLYARIYYPQTRTLKNYGYAVNGRVNLEQEAVFSEQFNNWTGYLNLSFNEFTNKTTQTASYYNNYNMVIDTIPIRNVNDYDNNFDIVSDEILYHHSIPYSGKVNVKFNSKTPVFNSKKGINFQIPRELFFRENLEKDYNNYKKYGKSKYSYLYALMDISEIESANFSSIQYLFFGFLGEFISQPNLDDEYYDDSEELDDERKEPKEKNLPVFSKNLIGKFKNGKPEGLWIIKDQFGNTMYEIPFLNGEIDGVLKMYSDILPLKDDYYVEESWEETPKHKKHYLESITTYKKGLRQGEALRYNWKGELIQKENYKDDLLNGPAIERNNLAYTSSNYEENALDGYVETYLTMKDRDTTLLYSLNFQNGMLQGESKSFHLNGKISKRGFFLNGQPIDDYEAFDSLGMKYHYVKFQYSFPIEEKIWEESELSVRYLFDWKDSIYFRPSDITSSQSLDKVMAEHGIGMEYFNRPYYGRPSLVSKSKVKYQLTKYYPNDTIARDGFMKFGKKIGPWVFYNYYGQLLYKVNYFDTLIKLNDSISFISSGIYSEYDTLGNIISKSYIVEKYEKYDCSHSDHYEIRQFYTFWEKENSKQINGYVKHHYDNGTLQSEGQMKDGLPVGIWKFYDPYGKLNQVGLYINGKRDGRWLGGDLSKTKYLGDICLNPNLPDLEETIKMREKQLDITITNYHLGKAMNKEFYDVDWSEIEKEDVIEEGE
ncbi:MAG: hypothetical protein HYR91_09930 [Flavobacteriia bacterium]|nr:hypothetical protein [Flavobacteriia bacterium]